MKMKHFLMLAVMVVMTLSAKAMSYEEAKDNALFLSDKISLDRKSVV